MNEAPLRDAEDVPDNPVAISFWIVSIAMAASTCFFLMECLSIKTCKTSMTVGVLVTLIAGVHNYYMRKYRVMNYVNSIVYRYIDAYIGFDLGLVILFENFAGEGVKSAEDASEAAKTAFNVKRLVVYIGWFICPLGGFLGRLLGAVDDVPLKLIYNVADFANTTVHMLQLCSALADAEIGQVGPRHRCCECGGKFTTWVCPRCTGLLCGQCWQAHRQRCLCGGLIGDGAGLNRSALQGLSASEQRETLSLLLSGNHVD